MRLGLIRLMDFIFSRSHSITLWTEKNLKRENLLGRNGHFRDVVEIPNFPRENERRSKVESFLLTVGLCLKETGWDFYTLETYYNKS